MDKRPAIERLKEVLSYNPETGQIVWRTARGRCPAGQLATCTQKGYLMIQVDGYRTGAHRVAWALHHGGWPPAGTLVDHANGIRLDNSADNLRLASRSQNQFNRGGARTDCISGFRGVSKVKGGFSVKIQAYGEVTTIGTFRALADAVFARSLASILVHGKYAGSL